MSHVEREIKSCDGPGAVVRGKRSRDVEHVVSIVPLHHIVHKAPFRSKALATVRPGRQD